MGETRAGNDPHSRHVRGFDVDVDVSSPMLCVGKSVDGCGGESRNAESSRAYCMPSARKQGQYCTVASFRHNKGWRSVGRRRRGMKSRGKGLQALCCTLGMLGTVCTGLHKGYNRAECFKFFEGWEQH